MAPEDSTEDIGSAPIVRQLSDPPIIKDLIKSLDLSPHPEGGYFRRTHMNADTLENTNSKPRSLSSSIYYLLTPSSPIGRFHRHPSLTVHCLHKGKGRYVLIHDDGKVETFPVGLDVEKGERMQWVVGGGIWKASWALGEQDDGLLISEVVIPAFSFDKHEFLTEARLESLVGAERARGLNWLVRRE